MEENLQELIRLYFEDKQQLDNYKKSTDAYNKDIKDGMTELGIDEFVTRDGITAKMSIQKRESFNEDKLIEKLKELKISKPIKTIEVIDYDALEDAIYNNELDATKIADCKQVKEITVLKVTKKKG